MTKTTPNEELRELIEHFHSRVNDNERKSGYSGDDFDAIEALYHGIAIGRKRSARELERVIEETEDTQKTAGSYNE